MDSHEEYSPGFDCSVSDRVCLMSIPDPGFLIQQQKRGGVVLPFFIVINFTDRKIFVLITGKGS
jgi:hypothetical protein